jgi:hypothetical protein
VSGAITNAAMNSARRATAFHEAAHAALAIHYGFEVDYAVVDANYCGETTIFGTADDYRHQFKEATSDESAREHVRDRARRRIEVCAAGGIGEALATGNAVRHNGGDTFLAEDFRLVALLGLGMTAIGGDAIEEVDAEYVRMLLGELWRGVEAIASELVLVGLGVHVSGARLLELVNAASSDRLIGQT